MAKGMFGNRRKLNPERKNKLNNMTDTVRVIKHPRSQERFITSKNKFFEGELVIKCDSEKILFRKPTLDDKKVKRVWKDSSNTYIVGLVCDIPVGIYKIDKDDSNEDVLCCYFTQ